MGRKKPKGKKPKKIVKDKPGKVKPLTESDPTGGGGQTGGGGGSYP